MWQKLLWLSLGCIVFVGCASTPGNLAQRSAGLLGCPLDAIQVSKVRRSLYGVTWQADGCGKRCLGSADDMVRYPVCTALETKHGQ